jgi:hypothetical protein
MTASLKNILNSTRGKTVLSILLGLGLATLFRRACNSRNCLVFNAPSIKNIKGKVFSHNNKCYKYREKGVTCNDTSGNIVLEMGDDTPQK